jgi:hypothetical protein
VELGLVIRTLPRFSSAVLDHVRVEAKSGIVMRNGSLWPRGDWRPVLEREAEILGLMRKPSSPHSERIESENAETISIFELPFHLLRRWQRISGELPASAGVASVVEDVQYQRFVSQLVDFFRFKRVPLPSKCRFTVVCDLPVNSDASGAGADDSNEAVEVSLIPSDEAHLAVNLGTAASSLIFINVPIARVDPISGENGEIMRGDGRNNTELLFSRLSDCPCLRIIFPPRKGYLICGSGILHSRCPISRTQPDIWLCVSPVRD